MKRVGRFAGAALALLGAGAAAADEGMWPFDEFPFERVKKAYNVTIDQAWLDRVRKASLRLNRNCSGAFVSAQGLVQTNHHCIDACIEQHSTAERDIFRDGFSTADAAQELRCRGFEASQLVEINDVTARLQKAAAGKSGEAAKTAVETEKDAILTPCSDDEGHTCELVEFFGGAKTKLYRFRTFRDVRLVFVPERAIAYFGGDLLNFEFPRTSFDVSFLRVYSGDKPLDTTETSLRYAKQDAKDGDPTFTSGSPGWSSRTETMAQLEFTRDVTLPRDILYNSELRLTLKHFAAQGPEQERLVAPQLTVLENSLKSEKGRYAALTDPQLMRARAAAEATVRRKAGADRKLRGAKPWDALQKLLDEYRPQHDLHEYVAAREGFRSRLHRQALDIARFAEEMAKPEAERDARYRGERLGETRNAILRAAFVDPALDKATFAFSLGKLQDMLGPDHPLVIQVLGKASPAERAAQLIDGTKLNDREARRRALETTVAELQEGDDPLLALAASLLPQVRAAEAARAAKREAEENAAAEAARAMFQLRAAPYPDASFTLRMSYGAVAGYREGGRTVAPVTRLRDLFDRATASEPFRLPDRWVAAADKLDFDTTLNLASTNDVVGGDSGSPLINAAGEVVGVVFDLNRQGLGGYYIYDGAVNRTVSLAVGALREALGKVYGAERLLDELGR